MIDHIPCLYLPYDDGSNKIIIYFHGNAEDVGLAFDLLYLKYCRDHEKTSDEGSLGVEVPAAFRFLAAAARAELFAAAGTVPLKTKGFSSSFDNRGQVRSRPR